MQYTECRLQVGDEHYCFFLIGYTTLFELFGVLHTQFKPFFLFVKMMLFKYIRKWFNFQALTEAMLLSDLDENTVCTVL